MIRYMLIKARCPYGDCHYLNTINMDTLGDSRHDLITCGGGSEYCGCGRSFVIEAKIGTVVESSAVITENDTVPMDLGHFEKWDENLVPLAFSLCATSEHHIDVYSDPAQVNRPVPDSVVRCLEPECNYFFRIKEEDLDKMESLRSRIK